MTMEESRRRALTRAGKVALVCTVGAWACSDDGNPTLPGEIQSQLTCSINTNEVRSGGVSRDGIPALTDPPLVGLNQPAKFSYMLPDDRVIGIVLDGQPIAVPHNVLWWHEIVNLNRGGQEVAVSFCPLTGSSLAFDRTAIGGAPLGVSGLLFQNNLVMFDRNNQGRDEDSLWPQMMAQARCGPQDGVRLPQFPVVEMDWRGWMEQYPNTLIISGDLGFSRDYTLYPYGNYESLSDREFVFTMPVFDDRRQQKERVVGVPGFDGSGIAFPFLALAREGDYVAVEETFKGDPIVLLWDSESRGGMVYSPVVGGDVLSFTATADGFVDQGTGSRWDVMGEAVDGPLTGTTLEPIAETYVAFWGAWINFHTQSRLWEAE